MSPIDDWFETDGYPASGKYLWRMDEYDSEPETYIIACGMLWDVDGVTRRFVSGGQWKRFDND
jgi:hypothetical protein